jgi:hypothetical protein
MILAMKRSRNIIYKTINIEFAPYLLSRCS